MRVIVPEQEDDWGNEVLAPKIHQAMKISQVISGLRSIVSRRFIVVCYHKTPHAALPENPQ